MDWAKAIVEMVIFPGFLFAAVCGLAVSWIDRFVTARVQMRVGPPPLQPFYDVLKLMIKETCVPEGGARWLFLTAPLIGLAGATLASVLLWRGLLGSPDRFPGDLIALLYLLTMPAVAVILGSFASRNPLASIGGSREMKLMLAYEFPLVLAVLVPVIHSGSIRIDELAARVAVAHPSGVLALLVAVLCVQAKLTLVPFDAPEAETELAGGAYIEYSGPPLAAFKLTRAVMLFTLPMLLVALFFGGLGIGRRWSGWLTGPLAYVGLVVIAVLIRNTAPRVRIDQAVRFFWGPVALAAFAAVGLALVGW